MNVLEKEDGMKPYVVRTVNNYDSHTKGRGWKRRKEEINT
jgi:hypothetical protein